MNIHQTENQEKKKKTVEQQRAAYWRLCKPLSGENEPKKELINVRVSLNQAPVHVKQTQYWKSTLLQNKARMHRKRNLQVEFEAKAMLPPCGHLL